ERHIIGPARALSPRRPESALQSEGLTVSSRQPSRQPIFHPSMLLGQPSRNVPLFVGSTTPQGGPCLPHQGRLKVRQHCWPNVYVQKFWQGFKAVPSKFPASLGLTFACVDGSSAATL